MAIDSFLILHGIENHRPPEHWQFWLAGRLRDRGHQVLYPGLPDPDAPRYQTWERELHRQLARMTGRARLVVCHSLACLLWLRAAGGLDERQRVDRLLLVAPPASEQVPDAGADFRIATVDGDAVAASVREPIRIACSDADPYNRAGAHKLYADALGAEADELAGAGHITPDTGYGRWPSIEAWCLDPTQRLRADGRG